MLFVGIGINSYPRYPLKGCLADIKLSNKKLKEKFGFTEEVVLLEASATLINITSSLYEAAIASWQDNLEHCFIHYSGHGSRVVDTSGDEISRMDSCWCPYDHTKAGMFLDDTLARILRTFNPKTRVFIISDSCHSATMADLPYGYDAKKGTLSATVAGQKIATKWDQNVVMISGCLDTGVSADAYFAATGPGGALTTYFWKIVDSLGPTITVKQLVDELHTSLKKDGYSQYPILTSSQPLTADSPVIIKKGATWCLC